MSAGVYLPGVGFRPRDGKGLASPVTIERDDGRGLRVMWLAATEVGTEISFEIRDPREKRRCADGSGGYMRWQDGVDVRLRDADGTVLARDQGLGTTRYSFGQHEYGTFGQRLVFEPLRKPSAPLTLEVRGQLGDWDVPLELVPLEATSATPSIAVDAPQTHGGVTVRVAAVAVTEAAIAVDIVATTDGAVSALEIRSVTHGGAGLSLVDGHGRRFDEVSLRAGMDMSRGAIGRAVAVFPHPTTAEATLIVTEVTAQQTEGELEISLPVFAPADALFGRHPVVVRYAAAVDALRTAPNQDARSGLEIQVAGEWRDDQCFRRPGPIHVDGVHRDYSTTGYRHGEPEAAYRTIAIPMDAPGTARVVTMTKPIVAIRGPWEVRFAVLS